MGINAFVVWHRLPASPDLVSPEKAPLQDIQRAMRMIYANAAKWGIDPKRVGVFGTSAGGHGASTLATHPEDVSAIGDALDPFPYKPAFSILLSPVISFKNGIVHKGSRDRLLGAHPSAEQINTYSNETRVTKETPPALLLHAHDDNAVSPLNSVVYYQALKAAGVPASLHIFPQGGHRLGMENNPGSAALWPALSAQWLKEMKFIP
ncbi:alpha/beta hydrolase [Paraflavisolibacter sp. H34]|uniref:alpha/beta hydrolase n=1 Tax=Huijunlia imazamoxiresistens TaxID=3127457 RepID=UPI003016715D